jgi:endoglucanase
MLITLRKSIGITDMSSTKTAGSNQLKIGPSQIGLLERLCNACAVSGMENEVRTIVMEEVKSFADEMTVDSMGNLLVTRKGKHRDNRRVMIAAHMDEVGFMLTAEDGEGIYRFEVVGGVNHCQLPGKSVWIGEQHIPGVIGVRPIHLLNKDELDRSIPLDQLRIDIGTASSNGKVKIGDRATFATSFTRIGKSIRAKALDDRLGVATLIELVKNAPPNIDLLAAFTVQEEIGLRGARAAAYAMNPQLSFVIDATPANDLPTWDESENTIYNTRLDHGPAIYIADRYTFSDPRLLKHLYETARLEGIPYQIRQPGSGGTDAGAIHLQRGGIPSVSVSVPTRYTHTAASIARISDWHNLLSLIYAALVHLPATILDTER